MINSTGDYTVRSDSDLLTFMHIPKTGGTTLTNIMCQQYQSNVKYSSMKYGAEPSGVVNLLAELNCAETLSGHFAYGVHRYIPRQCSYVTILRNPIEQVVSWFHVRNKSPFYDPYEDPIEAYVEDPRLEHENLCIQTRFVSGNMTMPNLEDAKYNLKHGVEVCAILERFDPSLDLLRREFGWQYVKYQRANVNPDRPLIASLSKSTVAKISKKYEMDMELYQYATQLLLEKLRDL
ncbi:sulfotransferase family 2 domain-containing protein [Alicyclobacillus sp. ALC3]|uniref:sulfotransferase family 2 domain-containing protein n=1 Tax=Alicyclobacillus sp. ALC3 TaxID=2796143 RepID=UPI00237911C7|nr:sulfotransferase family 2 domain-containing protein [Alicyclobacillus sp. ALC3]WDL95147.1 sulfotransferase family 2 domain-containing protein [Alicyclobacillus sp. ALC3]